MLRRGLISIALVLVWPSTVLAAVRENITASPTTVNESLNAGASQSGQLTIVNDGDTSYDFKVYATPFNVSGEDYQQSFSLAPNETDISRWFSFSRTTYHMEPHQRLQISYTVKIPAGAAAGGYYATVFAETVPSASDDPGIRSHKRVGTIFYLKVNGAVVEKGSLVDFVTNFWQPGAPLTATTRLRNDGNVHYQADINVTVTDLFGRPKAKLSTSKQILPKTIRRIEFSWDKAPGFGLFKVTGNAVFLGQSQTFPTHYVLMMSATSFVVLFIVLLILGGLLYMSRRNVRRR